MIDMTTTSPEITAGAGFSYEDCVGAYFLAALLGEHSVVGVGSRVVKKVSFQQKSNGFPLDDFVIEATANDVCVMSLQGKRSLTISAANTNQDFREVVTNAWKTLKKPEFSLEVDRVGAVVEYCTNEKLREINRLCDTAQNLSSESAFCSWIEGVQSGKEAKSTAELFLRLIQEVSPDASYGDVFVLLRHFVIVQLRIFDGARNDEQPALDRLRMALRPDSQDDAVKLWSELKSITAKARAHRGRIDRSKLTAKVAPYYRLSVSRSFKPTIDRLQQIALTNAADIKDQIAGIAVAREDLMQQTVQAAKSHKLILLRGDPGCGKSALLKRFVTTAVERGPTLFLKADRITGSSWIEYASKTGLDSNELSALLQEIGSTGQPILFIDGIDRIGTEHRGVILDLLRTINLPECEQWRCIATIRDSGLELFKSWLPIDDANALHLVSVKNFSDPECEEIADAIPRLRPLVFGTTHVQEIARRPFFANVLAKQSASTRTSNGVVPASEAALLLDWWKFGAYCTEATHIAKRQMALLDIAKKAAANYERTVSITALSNTTADMLDELIHDQMIRRDGHTHYTFSHDVFFEWSYCFVLESLRNDWLNAISDAGEPPVLARTVELLSQVTIADSFDKWSQQLSQVVSSKLRTQWTRAWLFGAFGVDRSQEVNNRLEAALFEGSGEMLRKLFVWLQAEKTIANPNIINASNIGENLQDQIATAEMYAWPSDFRLWAQVIYWTLDRRQRIPSTTTSSFVQVLMVWQNACFQFENPVSKRIVATAIEWLTSLDDPPENRSTSSAASPMSVGHRALEKLESELRLLVLRASASYPDEAGSYLTSVATTERIKRDEFSEIQTLSFLLAQTLPETLCLCVKKALLEPLPKAQIKHQEESNQRQIAYQEKLRRKPKEEWTQLERMSSTNIVFSPSLRSDEWHDLCIRDHGFGEFFPASPLREPFYSLFQHAPQHALAITKTLVQHAVTAWREMLEIPGRHQGIPIPIRLTFPWGEAEFWGDDRHYMWHRGVQAAYPLCSALMALEHWAFAEVERGRERDEVLKDVLLENPAISALGIAAAICLEHEKPSPVSFALLSSQRLWKLDIDRFVSDRSSTANLIGFSKRTDAAHHKAVSDSNARACRRTELRALLIPHLINSDRETREALAKAIRNFPNSLPFAYEHERNDSDTVHALTRTSEIWAQLGIVENYSVIHNAPAEGQFSIVHNNPLLDTPELQQSFAETNSSMEVMNLAARSASAIEHQTKVELAALLTEVGTAKKYESKFFSSPSTSNQVGLPIAGAIVTTAALCVRELPDTKSEEFFWALKIIQFAEQNVPKTLGPWLDDMLPMFDVQAALAIAYGALIRRGVATPTDRERLLTLCASNNYKVALEAIKEVFGCAETDPALVWEVLELSFQIADIDLSWEQIHDESRRHEIVDDVETLVSVSLKKITSKSTPTVVSTLEATLQANEERRGSEKTLRVGETYPRQSKAHEWRWGTIEEILRLLTVEQLLNGEENSRTLHDLLSRLLDWTIVQLTLDDDQDGSRSARDKHREFRAWNSTLGALIARSSINGSIEHFDERYLSKIRTLTGENLTSLLATVVTVAVMRIHDDKVVPKNALKLLDTCVDELIAQGAFKQDWRKEGKIYDDALRSVVKDSLMVSVEHAGAASRFSNSDWSEIDLILPVVDKVVGAASWAVDTASAFISLCERAGEHCPTAFFEKHAIDLLAINGASDWVGLTLPHRFAALVQRHAERAGLNADSKIELLRILDYLVDIGDRRSAALQLSPEFKNVRVQ